MYILLFARAQCVVFNCICIQEAGRLLPCGMDKWVHVNCAVWSAEVYEEHSGLLGMVHTAINRGAQLVRYTGMTLRNS